MDDSRFDDLTRLFGALSGRRRATATLLGVVPGLLGLAPVSAGKSGKCKPDCGECESCDKGKCKKKKNGKKSCKKGKCEPIENGSACTAAAGGTCQDGTCICPAGLTNCNGVCSDLQTDDNCGACGVVCTANEVCQSGRCFAKGSCPADTRHLCDSGVPVRCTDITAAQCICEISTEGNVVCLSFRNVECPPQSRSCETSADCPTDSVCVDISSAACGCGPGAKVCIAECPVPDQ